MRKKVGSIKTIEVEGSLISVIDGEVLEDFGDKFLENDKLVWEPSFLQFNFESTEKVGVLINSINNKASFFGKVVTDKDALIEGYFLCNSYMGNETYEYEFIKIK